MIDGEVIAKLVGVLQFKADYKNLIAMEQRLKSVEALMKRMGAEATALQAKLNKSFNITGKGANTAKLKADALVTKSLDKELATETKLSRLRRQQFQTQLAEQKLTFTGERNAGLLQGDKLKAQTQSAVLAAKQHKAAQESLKVDLGRAKLQGTVEQSKIREAKLADILQRRQAQTVRLQQEAARHASTLQRAEAGLNNARAAGIRAAEKHLQSKQAHAAREARATIAQDQRAQRLSMATERHTAWQAKQAEPASGMGFSGLSLGIGAAGAAIYSLTSAISYLGERIKQRQESASDSQQFDNTLLAAGDNDKDRKKIREAYIDNSQEFGMKIDRESAVAYSNMIQGFRAQGKTLEEAIQLQKDQAAVFRIGNLNATQQFSARTQLNQGYGKDRFLGQDLRPLTDALGTRLTTILYKAIGKSLGYKGPQSKLAGFVLDAQADGKVNGAMVQQGMRDIVAQSPELLERHKHSLDAQAARVENDAYLRTEAINRDPVLVEALGERLTAERQLIESTKALHEAFKDFDVGLVKISTAMLRLLAGKNADDTDKTPEQRAEEIGKAGFPEGAAIDASVMGGGPRANTGEKVKDPISRLFRWLTNTPDYEEGPAKDVKALQYNMGGVQFPKFDMSRLGVDPENLADGKYRQFRLPEAFDPSETFRRVERLSQPYFPGAAPGQSQQPQVPNVTNTNSNNTTTIQPAQVKVDIHVTGMTAEEVEKISSREAQEVLERSWREAMVNQKEEE